MSPLHHHTELYLDIALLNPTNTIPDVTSTVYYITLPHLRTTQPDTTLPLQRVNMHYHDYNISLHYTISNLTIHHLTSSYLNNSALLVTAQHHHITSPYQYYTPHYLTSPTPYSTLPPRNSTTQYLNHTLLHFTSAMLYRIILTLLNHNKTTPHPTITYIIAHNLYSTLLHNTFTILYLTSVSYYLYHTSPLHHYIELYLYPTPPRQYNTPQYLNNTVHYFTNAEHHHTPKRHSTALNHNNSLHLFTIPLLNKTTHYNTSTQLHNTIPLLYSTLPYFTITCITHTITTPYLASTLLYHTVT